MRRPSRALVRRAFDVALPLAVAVFLLGVQSDAERNRELGPLLAWIGFALCLAQAVVVCWRRSHPGLVMIASVAGGLASALVVPESLFPAAGMVALASLTVRRPPTVTLPALAALIGIVSLSFRRSTAEDTEFVMVVVGLVWALAEAVRNHRAALAQGARRAVSEERARIARELHDVLAHSVSVIVVQAAAADDVFDTRPDQARGALRAIEAAGREALGELRLLLAGVRPDTVRATGSGPAGDGARPSPGLDRLDEVTGPLRGAGLDVDVRRVGTVRPVPPGVDLSAYRIVQEALTNTLRHARARRAVVELRYGDDLLEVRVDDDGRGAPADGWAGENRSGGGLGLVGMRERAAMLGGRLDAGPAAGGGYRVHARLPLGSPQSSGPPQRSGPPEPTRRGEAGP